MLVGKMDFFFLEYILSSASKTKANQQTKILEIKLLLCAVAKASI